MTRVYNVVYDKLVSHLRYGVLYDHISTAAFSKFNNMTWSVEQHVNHLRGYRDEATDMSVDWYNDMFIDMFDENYTSKIEADTVHVLILLPYQLQSFKHQLERTGLTKYIVLETVAAVNHNYLTRTPPQCLTTLVLYFKGFKQS